MTSRSRLGLRRAPLLALAFVALVTGLWGGLLLLGLSVPAGNGEPAALHGVLMAFGFLGTLISLERAVALARPWAYAAPAACGAGVMAAVLGAPDGLGPALVTAGGFVLVAASIALLRLTAGLHDAIMALGALSWCAAGGSWLAGAPISRFAQLLAGFLVLTIVGERLELSRVLHLTRGVRVLLLGAVALLVAGLALSLAWPDLGTRIAGAGLVGQALWLGRFDVARRTIRTPGLTRYMACALLAGYVWLGVGGALWAQAGGDASGFVRDTALHAVFLGFVMSMVFAHAPVIVPAVLRVTLPYRPRFVAHLVLLHASLGLRVVAGDAGDRDLWQWAGVLNEAAIVLFLVSTAAAVAGAQRPALSGPSLFIRRKET